jgi:hypothetical protein
MSYRVEFTDDRESLVYEDTETLSSGWLLCVDYADDRGVESQSEYPPQVIRGVYLIAE